MWALLALVLGSSGPAQAGSIGEIRIYDRCVQGNGRGKTVTLQACNDSHQQKWFFAASLITKEVFRPVLTGLDTSHYVLRNAEWPDLCLDVDGESTVNGTRTILWPCHGRTNQQWGKSLGGAIADNGWLVSGNGKCLNAAQHSPDPGTWLIIWDCLNWADNEVFTYGSIEFISNGEAADFGFAAFKSCKELDKSCRLVPSLPFVPKDFKYGFHTGAGWGGGATTLDFGDQYSLDKCSFAHDKWCWVGDGEADRYVKNWRHYIGCLEKTLPGAREDVEAHFYALSQARELAQGNALEGKLPCDKKE